MHVLIAMIYFIVSFGLLGCLILYTLAVPYHFFRSEYNEVFKNLSLSLSGIAGVVLGLSAFYDYGFYWAILPFLLGNVVGVLTIHKGKGIWFDLKLLLYTAFVSIAVYLLLFSRILDWIWFYLNILF